jgi:hypothetical protein
VLSQGDSVEEGDEGWVREGSQHSEARLSCRKGPAADDSSGTGPRQRTTWKHSGKMYAFENTNLNENQEAVKKATV